LTAYVRLRVSWVRLRLRALAAVPKKMQLKKALMCLKTITKGKEMYQKRIQQFIKRGVSTKKASSDDED